MRIAIGGIAQETNSFSAKPTTLQDFRIGSPTPDFCGGAKVLDYFRATRTVLGGFMEEAALHSWSLQALLWTFATPGGIVTRETYEFLKNRLLGQLDDARPIDAVVLDLHGAMAAEHLDDADGDLLAAVRQAIGPELPLVATIDLHANVSQQMIDQATMLIPFNEYPHTDLFERGREAGQVLAALLSGCLVPKTAFVPMPLLTLPPMQCTLREPMNSVMARARELESTFGVVNASVVSGFPFADVFDAGVSVIVTTNDDQPLAQSIAEKLAEFIWNRRSDFTPKLTSVSEAIETARQTTGLVVLADGSDNPGGGAPCDGTVILQQLIEINLHGATIICIHDPETVRRAIAIGVGHEAEFEIGGKTDDRHGHPVKATAYVRQISDGVYCRQGSMGGGVRECFGQTVVLLVGNVEVVVTENRLQPYDIGFPRSLGIEPAERKLLAIKSTAHFRGSYQNLVKVIFDADTPGIHRPDFAQLPLKKVRRPIFPLDVNVGFRAKTNDMSR